ncbi:MAG: NAD(P)-binding protein [Monoraphidium minutum]|nr:MAG: NAD(P)-binding protein [Monoraphidium minutum]
MRAGTLPRSSAPRGRRAVACSCQSGQSLFIFGLGYTSLGLVRQAEAQQRWQRIVSTSRSPERLAGLETQAHSVVKFDPTAGADLEGPALDALMASSHVLTSVPPAGLHLYDPVTRAQLRLLRRRAEAAAAGGAPPLRWLGVLSSTSVYGDHGGGWVDESSEARPGSRGLVRLEHEDAWAALARELQLPLSIFRLGGIYGPGRSVLDAVRRSAAEASGSQRRRASQHYISRCHAADIAAALLASMAAAEGGGGASSSGGASGGSGSTNSSSKGGGGGCVSVFNVADDAPAGRDEVEAFARTLLGLPEPPPPQDEMAPAGGAARGGAAEEKRVGNAKIKAELGVRLRYPTYKEGLAAIAAGVADPFLNAADVELLTGRPFAVGA